MRFGTVAIVGRSNVGKSTFLNAALGEPLAIVSPRPQTTRENLLGIVRHDGAQIAFVDTPGLHRPHTELGRRMNANAEGALRSTDVVVLMTDVSTVLTSRERAAKQPILEEDAKLLAEVPPNVPCVVAINKIDLLKDKARLLPMIAAFSERREVAAFVPLSALEDDGVGRVLDEVGKLLPEGPEGYDESTLTDRPASFFAREYIREQVLRSTAGEVPHAVAVSIDEFSETERLAVIKATLHVEKPGQRAILVGRGGSKIKEIGIGARRRIEELLGKKVHLELFVRVTPRWKDVPRQLAELGYDAPEFSGETEEGASRGEDGGPE
jgi:GTP-binding protein Era